MRCCKWHTKVHTMPICKARWGIIWCCMSKSTLVNLKRVLCASVMSPTLIYDPGLLWCLSSNVAPFNICNLWNLGTCRWHGSLCSFSFSVSSFDFFSAIFFSFEYSSLSAFYFSFSNSNLLQFLLSSYFLLPCFFLSFFLSFLHTSSSQPFLLILPLPPFLLPIYLFSSFTLILCIMGLTCATASL